MVYAALPGSERTCTMCSTLKTSGFDAHLSLFMTYGLFSCNRKKAVRLKQTHKTIKTAHMFYLCAQRQNSQSADTFEKDG